jgi:hypothetical protein
MTSANLIQLLRDSAARRCVAQIREMAYSGSDLHRDALVTALNDRRPQVARAAREALAECFVIPHERLWRLLAVTTYQHTRSQIVALFARGERVESIIWLLNACALDDDAVRNQACVYLRRWNMYWQEVAPHRLSALVVALHRARKYLPADVERNLAAYVKFAGGEPHLNRLARADRRRHRRLARKAASIATPVPLAASGPASAPVPQLEYLSGRVVRRRFELAPRLPAALKWKLLRR